MKFGQIAAIIGILLGAAAAALFAIKRTGRLRTEQAGRKAQGDGLLQILMPSVAGLCICVVCLCGTSWAWFTAGADSDVATVETAVYTVSAAAESDGTAAEIRAAENGVSEILLEAGKTYTVTLTPTGTAKNGYCTVQFEGNTYYTGQLASGSLTFTVNAGSDGTMSVTPQWGTCAVETPEPITDGTTLGTAQEAPSDAEEQPDTPADDPASDVTDEDGTPAELPAGPNAGETGDTSDPAPGGQMQQPDSSEDLAEETPAEASTAPTGTE